MSQRKLTEYSFKVPRFRDRPFTQKKSYQSTLNGKRLKTMEDTEVLEKIKELARSLSLGGRALRRAMGVGDDSGHAICIYVDGVFVSIAEGEYAKELEAMCQSRTDEITLIDKLAPAPDEGKDKDKDE